MSYCLINALTASPAVFIESTIKSPIVYPGYCVYGYDAAGAV